ncbi:UNVERIFIED_CONTAM: hypothetical protein Sangu_0565900 [Sesamum angustifolium]|uniref:Uncharacterized protein n=1 Tax=Sesamum angustifolium TaxID=2727405 RepID=A0AAW2QA94_9LAMI
MCCLTYKIIILVLFCIGLLSVQTENVSASRSWSGEGRLLLRSSHVLNTDALQQTMNVPLNVAPPPAMAFDPNQSGKRQVRGGSDPIHNRS